MTTKMINPDIQRHEYKEYHVLITKNRYEENKYEFIAVKIKDIQIEHTFKAVRFAESFEEILAYIKQEINKYIE